MSIPPINESPAFQVKYPDNTDALFDQIQGKPMSKAMEIFNAHMDQPAPRRQKSEWETIWPRISMALIEKFPDVEFPDPTAPYFEIQQFLMSNESLPLLATIRKIDLSGLDLAKVPPLLLRCKNLEILDLSMNPRLRDLPEWINFLAKLETLDIENTSVTHFPPLLACHPSLQTLIVSTDLKSRIPRMSDVEIIACPDNPVEHKIPLQNWELAQTGQTDWHKSVKRSASQYPGLLDRLRKSGFSS